MPTFVYKAVTKSGKIVRNKVEDQTKQDLLRKLKRNNLMPISVIQVRTNKKTVAKSKKRVNINNELRNINTSEINKRKTTYSRMNRINDYFKRTEKVTPRDIVIFTQNFYLLKKANFNNIHALSTVIETTENLQLRDILEDILAGVESRR